MKAKILKALDVFIESVFFLIITYTLSGMYTSFKFQWFAILFRAANIFATIKYYNRVNKITDSRIAAVISLILCFIIFAYLAYSVGYIRGEFTPFTSLW